MPAYTRTPTLPNACHCRLCLATFTHHSPHATERGRHCTCTCFLLLLLHCLQIAFCPFIVTVCAVVAALDGVVAFTDWTDCCCCCYCCTATKWPLRLCLLFVARLTVAVVGKRSRKSVVGAPCLSANCALREHNMPVALSHWHTHTHSLSPWCLGWHSLSLLHAQSYAGVANHSTVLFVVVVARLNEFRFAFCVLPYFRFKFVAHLLSRTHAHRQSEQLPAAARAKQRAAVIVVIVAFTLDFRRF